MITLLRQGNRADAAVVWTRYIMDVRDAFELVNGRLLALREWSVRMKGGQDAR